MTHLLRPKHFASDWICLHPNDFLRFFRPPDFDFVHSDFRVVTPGVDVVGFDLGVVSFDRRVGRFDPGVGRSGSRVVAPDLGVVDFGSGVVTPDLRVAAPDPDVVAPDLRVVLFGPDVVHLGSDVVTRDPGVVTFDLGVVTPDSGVGRSDDGYRPSGLACKCSSNGFERCERRPPPIAPAGDERTSFLRPVREDDEPRPNRGRAVGRQKYGIRLLIATIPRTFAHHLHFYCRLHNPVSQGASPCRHDAAMT